jgi:catechol 2,3-dioxygenase
MTVESGHSSMTDSTNRPPTFAPPIPAPQLLPAASRLGAVHLDVTDGDRARTFWTRYVGLTEVSATSEAIALGVDDEPLIVLHPGATAPVVPRHTGLYHIAIHLPEKKELARVVARLLGQRYPNSPTDHAETMATYFSDPDGNGIELTFETPQRGGLALGDGRGVAIMADGSTQGPTEPLDLEDLLSTLTDDDDLTAPMPTGTRIGHVHLHVTDLHKSRAFYRDVVGIGDLRFMDGWGMADLSLETSYVPHALALNIWNGPSATPRPEGTAGLRQWTLLVPGEKDLDAIEQRVSMAGTEYTRSPNSISLRDESANPLLIAVS